MGAGKCKPMDDRAGTGNDPLAAADYWQTVMGIRTHAGLMRTQWRTYLWAFMDWFPITQANLLHFAPAFYIGVGETEHVG